MLDFPIYNATISDKEEGLFCLSLVTDPATEVNFVYFDKDKPIVKFAVENQMERLVSGVIMLADTPIYRRTVGGYEYYINFTKDVLKVMAEKMIYDGVGSSVNIQHQDNSNVEGVNLVELFVIDREKGIAPTYFSEVPDGSLIGTYKVHNDEVWSMIENGDVLSFSLEGIFNMVEVEEFKNKKKTNIFKMKVDKVKAMLRKLLAQFGEIATNKGTILWNGEEDLKEGDSVYTVDEEGNQIALEDGEYTTEDDKIITVQDGKVVSIVDTAAEVEEEKPLEEEKPIEGAEEGAEGSEGAEETGTTETVETAIAELRKEVDELYKLVDSILDKIGESRKEADERFAKLEAQPLAKSATEQFENLEGKELNKHKKRGYVW